MQDHGRMQRVTMGSGTPCDYGVRPHGDPLTPLREKGKGKEQGWVSCETCSKTARAHVRRKLPCACSFSEAGAATAEIVGNCFPQCAKDYALWAWYCRHFDRRRIVDRAYYYASCQRRV